MSVESDDESARVQVIYFQLVISNEALNYGLEILAKLMYT